MHSESQARLGDSASSTPLLLTIPEVADELRVDKRTVYRLLRSANWTYQSSMWVPAHACDVSIWSNIWRDSRPTEEEAAAARRERAALLLRSRRHLPAGRR